MLKFFRQTRQKLLTENPPAGRAGKLSKYFFYAVGEIALIVIGVLIALYLSNLNEVSKRNNAVLDIIKSLEKDLIENTAEAHRIINWAYQKDSLINLVLTGKVTRDSYLQDRRLIGLITTTYSYNIKESNVEKLLDIEADIPKEFEFLVFYLQEYRNCIERHNFRYVKASEYAVEFQNSLRLKIPWCYEERRTCLKEKIDFLLTDPHYPHEVHRWSSMYLHNAVYYISRLKLLSVIMISKIRAIKEDYSADEFNDLFIELGMTPFKVTNCKDTSQISENIHDFRTQYFLFNSSPSPAELIIFDENDEERNRVEVSSGEYFLTTLPKKAMVKWMKNGDCYQRYAAVKDGFVLLK